VATSINNKWQNNWFMDKKINPTVCITLTSCTIGLSLLVGLFPIISLLTIPLAILALVFKCILHYQLWSAIPENARSTTPGKAVGFLFIPFFNLYWYFPSYVGLTTSIKKTTGKPSAEGLAVTYSVLSILVWFFLWIPIIGSLFTLALFIIWLIFINALVKDVNSGILHVQPGKSFPVKINADMPPVITE